MVWAPLAVGAAQVPLPKVDPADICRRIRTYGVTTLCAASTVLQSIWQQAREESQPVPRNVRVACAAGAPSPFVVRAVEGDLGWRVIHLYGLTETSAFLTHCEEPAHLAGEDPDTRAAFLSRQGIPLLLAGRVRVVRVEDGRDVLPNGQEMGEVVARGNVVMAGYSQDPEATREVMGDGWLHTGDLAVVHPDGYLEIRDRLKDVVKSGGEQIPSLEVEQALLGHPAVAEAAVVPGPHPRWGETPVAFLVARSLPVPEEDLRSYLRERLAHFKVPTRYVWVPSLPRNAAGKVQKHLLRAKLWESPSSPPPDPRPPKDGDGPPR